ncbi:unnamed protein product [Soboliphyme baturini]|uniref:Homeobox domain-containing protein n=1 Tax=Soboliphyme baturini TaxID=241478 RepID=A0A183IN88_9BILA|nr:unnamed protein product [Soboliphyme baturini]
MELHAPQICPYVQSLVEAFHTFDRLEHELTTWTPCTSNSFRTSMKNLVVSFTDSAGRQATPSDRSDQRGSTDENMRDCCLDQNYMDLDSRADCNGLCIDDRADQDANGHGLSDVSTSSSGTICLSLTSASAGNSTTHYSSLEYASGSASSDVSNSGVTCTAGPGADGVLCLSSPSVLQPHNSSEISTTTASASAPKGLLSKLNGSFQLTAENKEQLKELLKDGEENAMRKIREFVSRYQLRQQAIAAMTGISQPYVSKFLNGNARDLSDRVRNLMFTWYILCKNSPEKLAELPTDSYNRLALSDSGELLPQRRERFVFKPVHVRILEKYFQDDPYPNHAKREEIAARCNSAYKAYQLGSDLCPKEQVSEQIISNWFSNRRKEKKRKGVLIYSPIEAANGVVRLSLKRFWK